MSYGLFAHGGGRGKPKQDMSQALPHTFFLHGVVVHVSSETIVNDRVRRLTVAVGDDRVVMDVPEDVWRRDGTGVAVGSRVRAEGRTDHGPIGATASNVATKVELVGGASVATTHLAH